LVISQLCAGSGGRWLGASPADMGGLASRRAAAPGEHEAAFYHEARGEKQGFYDLGGSPGRSESLR